MAIQTVSITMKRFPSAFEGEQANKVLTADAYQACANIIRIVDQLAHLPRVRGAAQPSAS